MKKVFLLSLVLVIVLAANELAPVNNTVSGGEDNDISRIQAYLPKIAALLENVSDSLKHVHIISRARATMAILDSIKTILEIDQSIIKGKIWILTNESGYDSPISTRTLTTISTLIEIRDSLTSVRNRISDINGSLSRFNTPVFSATDFTEDLRECYREISLSTRSKVDSSISKTDSSMLFFSKTFCLFFGLDLHFIQSDVRTDAGFGINCGMLLQTKKGFCLAIETEQSSIRDTATTNSGRDSTVMGLGSYSVGIGGTINIVGCRTRVLAITGITPHRGGFNPSLWDVSYFIGGEIDFPISSLFFKSFGGPEIATKIKIDYLPYRGKNYYRTYLGINFFS